jgi:short subunit dehydrogenase
MAIPDVSGKSIAELISLKGRNAVVTGGARGIGRAICERFAEAGANVLIGDLDEQLAQEAAEQIAQQHGVKIIATLLDVADSGSISAVGLLYPPACYTTIDMKGKIPQRYKSGHELGCGLLPMLDENFRLIGFFLGLCERWKSRTRHLKQGYSVWVGAWKRKNDSPFWE